MFFEAVKIRKIIGKTFSWILGKCFLALIILRAFEAYHEHAYVTNILKVYQWGVWVVFIFCIPFSVMMVYMFNLPFERYQISIQNNVLGAAKTLHKKRKTLLLAFGEWFGVIILTSATVASVMIGDWWMAIPLGGLLILLQSMKGIAGNFMLKNKQKIEKLVGHPLDDEPIKKKKKGDPIQERLKAIR